MLCLVFQKYYNFVKIHKNLISYTLYKHETSEHWVTFVHGAGGSSSIWFKQIREFQKNLMFFY
jgi:pimeloyl-ACP methyl ester carboxylesterase